MIRFFRKEKNLAFIAVTVVFLALIRTLTECFRLEYVLHRDIPLSQLKPFLIGTLVAAVGALVMTFLLFGQRYKWMVAVALLVIAGLVSIKIIYRDYFIA
jgi:hypothetical protein